MLDPKGAKAEGDWAEVRGERQIKKDGFMIRGTVREDFGGGQKTKGEKGGVD